MLLSIVIPTHNRAKYAISTVSSLLRLGSDVQVVVCDSSDNNKLRSEVEEYSSLPNFCYNKTPTHYSVVDNFNEGVLHAIGEYVVFLGDDDLVSKELLDVARWAKKQAIDAVKFTFPAQYHWPDFSSVSAGNRLASKLVVKPFSGKIERVNAKESLRIAVSDLGRGVGDMPRAYSGMVSLMLLNKIVDKYGNVFGGVSPDIYSSVLISYLAEKVYLVDMPIVIPGVSGGSTSGQSVNGGHLGKLRENSHIGQFKDLVWDVRVPEFYSVPTVWGFSMLKALEVIEYPDAQIPFPTLYFKCYLRHFEYKEYINQSFKSYIEKKGWLSAIKEMFLAAYKEVVFFSHKINVYLRRKALFFIKNDKSEKIYENLTSTVEASNKIDEIRKNNVQFR
ncbi:glycosyltransferase family 2 protein [Vibrio tasmaniensis]|uniref:glycosyltransferase family 2 protein n=1 Tax=Vibrio tasmaniensis TaxID=212663 RepID=UPI00107F18C4|nr:glycosyltransferase [Vibrio tasmaniensis]